MNDDEAHSAGDDPAKRENDPAGRAADDSPPEDLPSANDLIGTLFEEASLWPILTVFLGSTGAFGAALLVLAIGDRNPFAAAALFLLLGMTTDVMVRARRNKQIRNLAKFVALFWTVATALALVAVGTGIA